MQKANGLNLYLRFLFLFLLVTVKPNSGLYPLYRLVRLAQLDSLDRLSWPVRLPSAFLTRLDFLFGLPSFSSDSLNALLPLLIISSIFIYHRLL